MRHSSTAAMERITTKIPRDLATEVRIRAVIARRTLEEVATEAFTRWLEVEQERDGDGPHEAH